MQPLTIDETKIANFLPSTKGMHNGKLCSIGLWDAAISPVSRKSCLDSLGLRRPTLDKPWTADEFEAALKAAKESGKFKYALDLGTAWTGECYPYAFSPFQQSFGSDIVNRSSYATAEGALNGEETFSWNGNWATLGALKAHDDVAFLPAPDFGTGPKIGAASWQFGVSAKSAHPDCASKCIEFALQDKCLAAFSDVIGLVPATTTTVAMADNYKDGGPLGVFFEVSRKEGLVRPVTPGCVVEPKVFEKATTDIANGADVTAKLDEINAVIAKNNGDAPH